MLSGFCCPGEGLRAENTAGYLCAKIDRQQKDPVVSPAKYLYNHHHLLIHSVWQGKQNVIEEEEAAAELEVGCSVHKFK